MKKTPSATGYQLYIGPWAYGTYNYATGWANCG